MSDRPSLLILSTHVRIALKEKNFDRAFLLSKQVSTLSVRVRFSALAILEFYKSNPAKNRQAAFEMLATLSESINPDKSDTFTIL